MINCKVTSTVNHKSQKSLLGSLLTQKVQLINFKIKYRLKIRTFFYQLCCYILLGPFTDFIYWRKKRAKNQVRQFFQVKNGSSGQSTSFYKYVSERGEPSVERFKVWFVKFFKDEYCGAHWVAKPVFYLPPT